jgi:hypothetical protein
LGEVRCLFDVASLNNKNKGGFIGRIWVEDQDYHVVRFNGSFGESLLISNYFNFDSWRTNVTSNLWLPAFVYTRAGLIRERPGCRQRCVDGDPNQQRKSEDASF